MMTPARPSTARALTQVASVIATLMPVCLALIVCIAFAPRTLPHVWAFFYPAVFASALIGGRAAGLTATGLATLMAGWLVVPLESALTESEPWLFVLPALLFAGTGVAFSMLQGRLRTSLRGARDELASMQVVEEERARLTAQLQSSQDFLRRAQTVAKVGAWRLSIIDGEQHWEHETHHVFGFRPGQVTSYGDFMASVHPDDRDFVDREWSAALRGQPYDIEHRIVVCGEERWIRERAQLEFGAHGELLGGIGTSQDVTDVKHSQQALERAHANEQRLRCELEEVTKASIAVSEAVAELPNTSLAEVLHTIVLQAQALTHAEFAALGIGTDPEQPFEPWISVGIPRETAEAIGRYPRPIGTLGKVAREGEILRVKDVEHHPSFQGYPPHHPPMRDILGVTVRYRGKPVGNLFLGNKRSCQEFTEHDERLIVMLAARAGVAIETATLYADEALQRAWLEAIIEQMPEGVIILDEQGQVVLQNAVAKRLCTETHRVHPDGRAVLHDVRYTTGAVVPTEDMPLYRALSRGETTTGADLAIVAPGDRWVAIAVSATPLIIEGRRAGAVTVFQDISRVKELERLRDEWASIVAHDLRQPVGVVSLTAAMLLGAGEGERSEREQRALERIDAAARRLKRMIDDLLDVSRIDSRHLSVERRQVDLGALVRRTVEHANGQLLGCRVRVSAAPGQQAYVDPERIQQVLENLLSNAVKYGEPHAPIDIVVETRADAVEVAVTNRGAGVPPDQLPRLFSRFGRTQGARTSGVPGVGLGLYIARGLIEAHGGRMWAESTPGETTTFHFSVPRCPPAAAEREAPPAAPGG